MKHETLLTIQGKKLCSFYDKMIKEWHKALPSESEILSRQNIFTPLLKNCFYNFSLWHTEDEARRTDIPDSEIAVIKRKIDGFNQKRNNAMEETDATFVQLLDASKKYKKNKKMNSETPGSICDRLCIISLKIFHMAEETARTDATPEHLRKCKTKLLVLKKQRANLAQSLDELVKEYLTGKKSLIVYFQFKMYNDPATNPALYGKK
jgi:hypothetical protein